MRQRRERRERPLRGIVARNLELNPTWCPRGQKRQPVFRSLRPLIFIELDEHLNPRPWGVMVLIPRGDRFYSRIPVVFAWHTLAPHAMAADPFECQKNDEQIHFLG